MKKLIATALIGALISATAAAKIVQKTQDYKVGNTEMTGVLVYDNASKYSPPGLVMVPNWMGINAANLEQAELIAGMGYVVFVADMYGKTIRPKDATEAGSAAGAVKSDRLLMRERVNSALAQLQSSAKTNKVKIDTTKLGAIGFCFGGTSALELGRSGAKVRGVVSFHGGLDNPTAYARDGVRAAFLVLHGADDPYVPQKEVTDFQTEMRQHGYNWEMISYGGAVHSFTDVGAKAKGQADYNEKVATRAYARMREFFSEVFAK